MKSPFKPNDWIIQDGVPDRGVYRFVRMCGESLSRFYAIPFGHDGRIYLKMRKCRLATDEDVARCVAKRIGGGKN